MASYYQASQPQMETQVKGPMLTPQPDMEISTSQSADNRDSGIIDQDFDASAAAAGEALPLLLRAPSSKHNTTHVIHAHRGRRPPPRHLPLKVLHI